MDFLLLGNWTPVLKGKTFFFTSTLSFAYWSGQVITSEWDVSVANLHQTANQMEKFDISAFGRKVSATNPALFRTFDQKHVSS